MLWNLSEDHLHHCHHLYNAILTVCLPKGEGQHIVTAA